MSTLKTMNAASIVVFAATCWLSTGSMRAQQYQKSASSSASTARTGSTPGSSAASRATESGGGSKWGAGVDSFASQKQQDGVWHDESTFGLKPTAAGTRPAVKSGGYVFPDRTATATRLSAPPPTAGRPGNPATAGRTLRPSSGLHSGIAKSKQGSQNRSTALKPGASRAASRPGTRGGQSTFRNVGTGTGSGSKKDRRPLVEGLGTGLPKSGLRTQVGSTKVSQVKP